jgi:putative ABC transport system permease protein
MKRRDEDDLNEELATHLRMAADERVARGESRADAEAAARREFGNVAHVAEVTREMHGGVWWERLRQDIRYGMRALRRTPAFTIVAVLTLAIGIGANSAMFTVVNGVLLRPLPFQDARRLFLVSYLPSSMLLAAPPSLLDRAFPEFRRRARSFERVASFARSAVTLTGAGDATRLSAARTTADFFGVLGVQPQKGRAFAPEEEQPGRAAVVVLSDHLWRERFAGDPGLVGKTITLDETPHIVVGIMPPRFDFPAGAELWTPLVYKLDPGNAFLQPVVGRLRAGVTPLQARAELESIMKAMPADPRDAGTQMVARIVPLQTMVTGKIETSLLIFSAAVAFVLLIACANVANLLLIRASSRRHEMAVRAALGASRTRLVRQLLTESTLVALIGGALGIIVAFVGVRALLAVAPAGRIPRVDDIHLDGWVVAFTFGVSLVTGLAFGVVPAMHGARRAPRESLSSGARTITGTHNRLRAGLVVAEIALALVLLAGAGLMLKSFQRIRTLDLGFSAGNVATMSAALPNATYGEVPRVKTFHTATLERLARIPGVTSAGAAAWQPLGNVGIIGDFHTENAASASRQLYADKPAVSPDYFRTMGIPLVKGRDFTWRDDAGAPGVAIVSETVARTAWPNENPIGKRITMEEHPRPEDWMTVVGVVADVVQDAQFQRHAALYLPYLQLQRRFWMAQMTYAVRTTVEPHTVMRAMRAALRDVDAGVAPEAIVTMDELRSDIMAEPLFQTRLLTIFSLVALLLAAIGTYGVLAYDVSERTHEIGLRMALGATPRSAMQLVMRRTLRLAAPGIMLGILGALAVSGVLRAYLFDVKPTDPATLGVVAICIGVIALAAGFVPARRATRVDPLAALRND